MLVIIRFRAQAWRRQSVGSAPKADPTEARKLEIFQKLTNSGVTIGAGRDLVLASNFV